MSPTAAIRAPRGGTLICRCWLTATLAGASPLAILDRSKAAGRALSVGLLGCPPAMKMV